MTLMRTCSLIAAMTGNPIVGAFMFLTDFCNKKEGRERQKDIDEWHEKNHKQFFRFAFGIDYDLVPESKYTEVWNRRHGDQCFIDANDPNGGEKMVRYYAKVYNLVLEA